MPTNALYGEIVFNNYTQLGYVYQVNPQFLIVNTLNNMTFNNTVWKSYIKPSDSYKFQIETNSASTCIVPSTDTRPRYYRFLNSYITVDANIQDPGVQLLLRVQQMNDRSRFCNFIIDNMTMENFYSHRTIISISANISQINASNVLVRNVTQPPEVGFGIYFLSSFASIYATSKFQSSTYSHDIFTPRLQILPM